MRRHPGDRLLGVTTPCNWLWCSMGSVMSPSQPYHHLTFPARLSFRWQLLWLSIHFAISLMVFPPLLEGRLQEGNEGLHLVPSHSRPSPCTCWNESIDLREMGSASSLLTGRSWESYLPCLGPSFLMDNMNGTSGKTDPEKKIRTSDSIKQFINLTHFVHHLLDAGLCVNWWVEGDTFCLHFLVYVSTPLCVPGRI